MHFSNQQRDFSSMSLSSEQRGIVAYFLDGNRHHFYRHAYLPRWSWVCLPETPCAPPADLGWAMRGHTAPSQGILPATPRCTSVRPPRSQPWPLEKFLVLETPWSR